MALLGCFLLVAPDVSCLHFLIFMLQSYLSPRQLVLVAKRLHCRAGVLRFTSPLVVGSWVSRSPLGVLSFFLSWELAVRSSCLVEQPGACPMQRSKVKTTSGSVKSTCTSICAIFVSSYYFLSKPFLMPDFRELHLFS